MSATKRKKETRKKGGKKAAKAPAASGARRRRAAAEGAAGGGKKAGAADPAGGRRAAAPALPRGSTRYRPRRAPMEVELPGTPLSSKQFEDEVITWSDRYTVSYDWDSGVAIAAYLDGLKEGKLLASYSPGSGRTVVPPRTFDELAWTPIDDLRELPGTGIINTFSLCMVNWDATRREEPLIPAVIELDGASPGMGIMHMIGEVEPDDVEIGMAVEAVWKPENERQGAITDIVYFRPRTTKGGGR